MKMIQAKNIAKELTNRTHWHTHGRSIKFNDLKELGLRINRIEDNAELADTVYRIQVVCRFLFDMSDVFKIFATQDHKIFRKARQQVMQGSIPIANIPKEVEAIAIDHQCEKCGFLHKFYAKLKKTSGIDQNMKNQGRSLFPSGNEFTCRCGNKINLQDLRKKIETQFGRKIF